MIKNEQAKEKYKNWVKAGLALLFTKEGLSAFADDIAQTQHADVLSHIKKQLGGTASGCDEKSLHSFLPLHYKMKGAQCPQAKVEKCNCTLGNKGKSCPQNFCGAMYDEITKSHRYRSPNWNNTDIHKWFSNPWEIAKCYIPVDGYKPISSHKETDLSGVLDIILNNIKMQQAIDAPLADMVHKIKEVRNQVLHSASMELDASRKKDIIRFLTGILSDTEQLANRQETQLSLRKLASISQEDYIITLEREADVCRAAVAETERNFRSIFPLKESIFGGNTEHAMKEREYQEKKRELKNSLISFYKQKHSTLTLSPLLPSEDIAVAPFYVWPEMVKVDEGQEENTLVKSYREIIYTGEKRNKTIYIVADAGMGKTTFCKRMILHWCKVQQDTIEYGNSENNDDETTLSEFGFLFYVPLCEVKDSGQVHSMIREVLPPDYKRKHLDEILSSEKCLIILDGLDEWVPRNSIIHSQHRQMYNEMIPQTKVIQDWTVITTSRPWKIEEVQLKKSECDAQIRILGLSEKSVGVFIDKIACILNAKLNIDKNPKAIMQMVASSQFASLLRVPTLLSFITCIMADNIYLSNSLCHKYTNMLEYMLNLATAKRLPLKGKPSARKLPACFDSSILCQDYKDILMNLGAVALDRLFDRRMDITSRELMRDSMFKNLTSDDMHWCLATGILSQTTSFRKSPFSQLHSKFSFVHRSVQEFLAALYLWSDKDFQMAGKRIPKCNRVYCTLDFNDFFVFVSGMNAMMGLYLIDELKDGTRCSSLEHEMKLQSIRAACNEEIRATGPVSVNISHII